MENQEKEINGMRTKIELRSWLRVRKVLTPHNVCPKTIPLIE